MLNIVIPMAGRGSRFSQVGYSLPKPLIPVHGVPMIQAVINNLRPREPHRFIFLCLKDHMEQFQLEERLGSFTDHPVIVPVDSITEGAACTVLLARHLIDSHDPLMIANCDQWVDIDINDYLGAMKRGRYDGFIMTMEADTPKWSYLRFNQAGEINEVVEKNVVSREATVGIYNFRKGSTFVTSALAMIQKNLRVNGEFYVAPVYNEMLLENRRIGYYNIGALWKGMYGLGTPDDLETFLGLPASRKIRLS